MNDPSLLQRRARRSQVVAVDADDLGDPATATRNMFPCSPGPIDPTVRSPRHNARRSKIWRLNGTGRIGGGRWTTLIWTFG